MNSKQVTATEGWLNQSQDIVSTGTATQANQISANTPFSLPLPPTPLKVDGLTKRAPSNNIPKHTESIIGHQADEKTKVERRKTFKILGFYPDHSLEDLNHKKNEQISFFDSELGSL